MADAVPQSWRPDHRMSSFSKCPQMTHCVVVCYNPAMMPKITNEMRDAIRRSQGRPVDVGDDQGEATYVLVGKETFAQMQTALGQAEEASIRHVRSLIEEGIASGDYQPADTVFAELRQFTEKLTSPQDA